MTRSPKRFERFLEVVEALVIVLLTCFLLGAADRFLPDRGKEPKQNNGESKTLSDGRITIEWSNTPKEKSNK